MNFSSFSYLFIDLFSHLHVYISYLLSFTLLKIYISSEKVVGRSDKASWRTNVQHTKTAIVRPQPQIVVVQRSPSPMPRKFQITTDERKSRLPLATSQNGRDCKYYCFHLLPIF